MKHLPPLLACLALSLTASAEPEDVQSITIKSMAAQMKYDNTEFTVRPGAIVEVVFDNSDDLPHNIAFCDPGTDVVALSMKQMEKPEEALKRNWMPDDPRIWKHSKLLNPHEKEQFRFTAPTKAGTYPYVCTFPGHAMTMKGNMRVVPMGEGLKDLKFAMYLGDWKNLPDFSKLTPHREGSLDDNLIQVKLDDYKNQFGVVYTGKIVAPKKGSYRFFIASDDGSRILIDGKKVVEADGIHPVGSIKSENVQLEKGDHEFRMEYFQAAGGIDIFAAWKGADFDITPLSKWQPDGWRGGEPKKKQEFLGMPIAVTTEPVIYRNFIAGAGNRAIAVGYPGGINIAWSAESMNLALVWRGAFMDAARHWINRGGGYQAPLGYDVVRPTGEVTPALAVADSDSTTWPKYNKDQRFEGYAWKGYTLDEKRQPTFNYEWNGVKVEDTFTATGNGAGPDAKLIRTIKLNGTIPANAFFRIATGPKIEARDGAFLVDGGKFNMETSNFTNVFVISADGAVVKGENLAVPAKQEIKVTYTWPK